VVLPLVFPDSPFLAAQENFPFSKVSKPLIGPLAFQLVLNGALSPKKKRLERAADYKPTCNAEIRNKWRYTSTSLVNSWPTQRQVYVVYDTKRWYL